MKLMILGKFKSRKYQVDRRDLGFTPNTGSPFSRDAGYFQSTWDIEISSICFYMCFSL
jgi:hypothetical protein